MVKQTIGFHWGPAGLANGMWTGVRLRDLLEKAGYDRAEARHVEFVGGVPIFSVLLAVGNLGTNSDRSTPVEDLPNKQDGSETKYGTSVDINSAMDPAGDIMIAYKYNGELLHPGLFCRLFPSLVVSAIADLRE